MIYFKNDKIGLKTITQTVFSLSGNVDNYLDVYFDCCSIGSKKYNGSGGNGTLQSGATSNGLYFVVGQENGHGDLSSSINMTPIDIEGLTDISIVSFSLNVSSSRDSTSVLQTPSKDNNYRGAIRIYDWDDSEGYYSYNVSVTLTGYGYKYFKNNKINNVYFKDIKLQ